MSTMADSTTYVFDDNGKAWAYRDGEVVASSMDLDALERHLAAPPPPPGDVTTPGGPGPGGPAPGPAGPPMDDLHDDTGGGGGMKVVFEGELRPADGSGSDADPLPEASPDSLPGDDLPPRATHIVTPNGLKGTILGKTKSMWGEQVTIRLENGRIAKFDVTDGSGISYTTENPEVSSPYVRLEAVLAADVDPTASGLRARIAALRTVKDEAKSLFSTGAYVDETTLHNIIVEADAQTQEVVEALEHMQQAEPYTPPTPQVFEQESVGGGDSTWLDRTVDEMVSENEGQDFDALMEEGPELLVAEMETPVLEDQYVVQDRAASFVQARTAGLEHKAVEDFSTAFLNRVEEVRKAELVNRQGEHERIAKAASEENYDGPAEGLFF